MPEQMLLKKKKKKRDGNNGPRREKEKERAENLMNAVLNLPVHRRGQRVI